MSLVRSDLISILAGSGKKALAEHRTSSQSFLAKGLGDRAFNAFPSLVTDQQVADLKNLIGSIKKIEMTPEGPILIEDKDKQAVEHWYMTIAREACYQMLDGFGHVKWELIDLLGWEQFETCYTKDGINQLVSAYVHQILQQAIQRAHAVVHVKPHEYFAFGVYFKEISDQLTLKSRVDTQVEDQRPRQTLLESLSSDYHATIQRIDKRHPILAKIVSGNQDKERRIESRILKSGLEDKTTELADLFAKMRLDCVDHGLAHAPLARIIKHYTNRLHSFKLNTKFSTLKLKKKLEDSKRNPEFYRSRSQPNFEKEKSKYESISAESDLVKKSEKITEAETHKMSTLAWWMSFFVNHTLPNSFRGSEHPSQTVRRRALTVD